MTGLQGNLVKDNIDKNYDKLDRKTKHYKYKIDKQMLSDKHKLIKTDKKNNFKVEEVHVKCNINTMTLNSGYTLGKVCVLLTIISCFLTFGGNIANFICNIPILSSENIEDYVFTWSEVIKTVDLDNNISKDLVQQYRFNLVTTLIYMPLIAGMQLTLYLISINIYIIKNKFYQYYKWALIVQYSMLGYSVYSNYTFIAHYVNPQNFTDKMICFIPSFLLDVACIFFLSLSMRMKTLTFDTEEKPVKKEVETEDKKVEIPDEKEVEIPDKKAEILTEKSQLKNEKNTNLENLERVFEEDKKPVENLDENLDENKVENTDEKPVKKTDIDFNKIYEKLLAKDPTNKYKIQDENKVENKVEKEVENNKKVTVKNAPKKITTRLTVTTGKATNKNKVADLKRVKKYIAKLKDTKINILKVAVMKEKCKIDKNKWAVIKPQLVKEGIIYMSDNNRITYINMKDD